MRREITYDEKSDRLAFVTGAADERYWNGLWQKSLTHADIARGDRFVTEQTASVLPVGARVMDAGCGIGATVYGLTRAGYDAYGVDYAETTIATARGLFPELKLQVADVRFIPFPDGSFDGIWSLGVIEHFIDDYEPVIEEARRVLRTGGYLFLTVPVISPLKAIKIRVGSYRSYQPADNERFFQFAFRSRHVVENVERHGFNLLRSFGRSGSFGLTEDLGEAARFLLFAQERSGLVARAWWRGIDKAVTPLTHHMRYFLFQKLR